MSNSDWIGLGLATITAIYAALTFGIMWWNRRVVLQMEMQSELLLRPLMTASIALRGPLFHLRIENQGRSAAQNVRLAIDRDFFRFGERNKNSNLKNLNAFSRAIPTFVSGQYIEFDLGTAPNFFSERTSLPNQFSISIEYNFGEKNYSDTFILDVSPYLYASRPSNAIES